MKLADFSPKEKERYPIETFHRFRFARLMLVAVAPLFYAYTVHFILMKLYSTTGFMLLGGAMTT